MEKIKERIQSFLSNSKARTKVLMIVGLAAMLLLALPDRCSERISENMQKTEQQFSEDEYARLLEDRLEEMISSIDGAGKTKVMITLQNSAEYVYATEDKQSSSTAQNSGVKESAESSYLVIRTDDGEEALIRTMLMPSVSGVLIVCEGADDQEVSERILNAVTTALGVSSGRVYITLLSTD